MPCLHITNLCVQRIELCCAVLGLALRDILLVDGILQLPLDFQVFAGLAKLRVGKLLLECLNVDKIFVTVRGKKGHLVSEVRNLDLEIVDIQAEFGDYFVAFIQFGLALNLFLHAHVLNSGNFNTCGL